MSLLLFYVCRRYYNFFLFYLVFFNHFFVYLTDCGFFLSVKNSNLTALIEIKSFFCYLLGDRLVIPFFVEFRIDPSRLKLDWRTIFMEFFGGNGGGDGSFNCSMGLCLPQRPIIIFNSFTLLQSNNSWKPCTTEMEKKTKIWFQNNHFILFRGNFFNLKLKVDNCFHLIENSLFG